VSCRVDENVFIFNVSVHNSSGVALQNCLDELLENFLAQDFRQRTLFTDEVKEILAVVDSFHDHEEGVCHIEVVDHSNDSGNVIDLLHECNLQWDLVVFCHLHSVIDTVFGHLLHGDLQSIFPSHSSVNSSKSSFTKDSFQRIQPVKVARTFFQLASQ